MVNRRPKLKGWYRDGNLGRVCVRYDPNARIGRRTFRCPMRCRTIPPNDFDRRHIGWRKRNGIALMTVAFDRRYHRRLHRFHPRTSAADFPWSDCEAEHHHMMKERRNAVVSCCAVSASVGTNVLVGIGYRPHWGYHCDNRCCGLDQTRKAGGTSCSVNQRAKSSIPFKQQDRLIQPQVYS